MKLERIAGHFGIYGDFLFSEATAGGWRGPLASALGPVASLAEEAIGLTQGNLVQWAQGKETNVGAELVRFGKGIAPGANWWYAKAALDRLFFHQLQELTSPGYLRQMKSRARREYGQRYWWDPGQAEPSRLPDLERALGK